MDPPNVFWFAGTDGPMLIVGTLMVIVSRPSRRAIWAVYGVLGYYSALLHYMITGLNESRWTFAAALFAVGLSISPPPGVTPA